MNDEVPALCARDIRVKFGEKVVLDGASLDLAPGQILGLLGANGAGKSTFVNVATGALRPDSGTIEIAGRDASEARSASASRIGVAQQETALYPTLSVRENLIGFAGLFGLRGRRVRARATAIIEALGLEASARTPSEQLSGGQRRRLHLGVALMHEPGMLFLDEPTVGSDIESRQQIVHYIRSLASSGTSVLYTTHYLGELEDLGAEIAILQQGRITTYGSVSKVVEEWGENRVEIRFDTGSRGIPTLEGWHASGDALVRGYSTDESGVLVRNALNALGERAAQVVSIDVRRSSLETAYLRITHGGAAAYGREEANRVAA